MGCWSGKHWYGLEQRENKSPENIRRCYAYLRSIPYQSEEDLARLRQLEATAVAEVEILEGGRDDRTPGSNGSD